MDRTQSPAAPQRKPLKNSTRKRIFKRDNFKCFYCGRDVRLDERTPHIDHQQPLARGGAEVDENRVAACAHCNTSKSGLTVEEFREAVVARSTPGRAWVVLRELMLEFPFLRESSMVGLIAWCARWMLSYRFPGEVRAEEDAEGVASGPSPGEGGG